MPEQRANLVLAGVTKAGTTALFSHLSGQPDIYAPTVKEINYFSPLVHGHAPGPLAEYAAHFSSAGTARWRLDASPFYFVGGSRVTTAMREILGRPRVLISLRDPVARLWSSYTFKKSKGRLPPDATFAGFFDECVARFEAGTDRQLGNTRYLTLRTGCYAEFLGAWLGEFGEDLMVVFADDLARSPGTVLAEVMAWLGTDGSAPAPGTVLRNVTTQTRSPALRSVAVRARRTLAPVLPEGSVARRALARAYLRINTTPVQETFHPDDRRRAGDFYAASTAATAALLGAAGYRTVPAWLTDAG